jgi:uncharacterized protein (TIGR02588 family)
MAARQKRTKKPDAEVAGRPWLEWFASSFGLVLFVSLVGILLWNVATETAGPPVIEVKAHILEEYGSGFLVEVEAHNLANKSVAEVEIIGELSRDGQKVEAKRVIIDYLPANSYRRAGLFFMNDPRMLTLVVRAGGYRDA